MKKYYPLSFILVALVVTFFAARWPALRFFKFEFGDLVSHLALLFFFALLIERTVEVVLTIWRADEANNKQAKVRQLLSSGTSAMETEVIEAQDALVKYRSETLRWAFPLSLFFGLLLAGIGVRVIDQFIDKPTQLNPAQLRWFNIADVVLTAALLAGGADPIHKVMDAFRKFMENSSAKASGIVSR